MTFARVSSRGRLTLARDVRQRAGIKPGDTVDIAVLGPGWLRLVVLPKLSPRELRDLYPIVIPGEPLESLAPPPPLTSAQRRS